jgi:hypothetical protein
MKRGKKEEKIINYSNEKIEGTKHKREEERKKKKLEQ